MPLTLSIIRSSAAHEMARVSFAIMILGTELTRKLRDVELSRAEIIDVNTKQGHPDSVGDTAICQMYALPGQTSKSRTMEEQTDVLEMRHNNE